MVNSAVSNTNIIPSKLYKNPQIEQTITIKRKKIIFNLSVVNIKFKDKRNKVSTIYKEKVFVRLYRSKKKVFNNN